MSPQNILDVLLIVLLIGWLGYRQTTWRPVVPGRMWRMPIILVVVGVVTTVQASGSLAAPDLAALVVEVAVSLGVGCWMGALAHFRRLETPVAAGDGHRPTLYESRTGWFGMALWIVMIAARIGIDVVAVQFGAHAAVSTGTILLAFGLNRLARVGVLNVRLDAHARSLAAA